MKHFCLIICFLLPASLVFGQSDTVKKINPVNNVQVIKGSAMTKSASARIKEIENIFRQIELKLNEINILSNKLKFQKDAISEMNQDDMLMLQQLMEKKSQLEQMISNTMKAANEGGQVAIQALK